MWQTRLLMLAGTVTALLFGSIIIRGAVGLSTAPAPTRTAVQDYEIPTFAALIECNAHFSHEILRIKNNLPAHNTKPDLPIIHRNYRRLHRLLRQIGRRDGIEPEQQTRRLRERTNQLHKQQNDAGRAARDNNCRQMAVLPIARKRHSQRIIGH